jgi:hypothetical protein
MNQGRVACHIRTYFDHHVSLVSRQIVPVPAAFSEIAFFADPSEKSEMILRELRSPGVNITNRLKKDFHHDRSETSYSH